jgi:hypothetical protein
MRGVQVIVALCQAFPMAAQQVLSGASGISILDAVHFD